MLTADRCREVLDYDPETGLFTRIQSRNSSFVGKVAGTQDKDGYNTIFVDGVIHKAHRLAWLYVHGVWPDGDIDHVNEDKTDNRISNLRDTRNTTANWLNRTLPSSLNRSGYRGVTQRPNGRWRANHTHNGVRRHLGNFDTAEQAHEAYLEAKRISWTRTHLS